MSRTIFRSLWPWLCPLTSFLEQSCLEHISYTNWDMNPKFGVWIHLKMMECHVQFLGHSDLDLWPGYNFFRIWSCWISNSREWNVWQHTSKNFALILTLNRWVGFKRSKQFSFWKWSYQIKENDTYNYMQAIILSFQAPSIPRVESKGQNSFSWKLSYCISCCISN